MDLLSLAQRLERAQGRLNERLNQAAGGQSLRVGGGFAHFRGPGHPLNQALGLVEPLSEPDLEKVEQFLGAPTVLELSPGADAALWPLLAKRGYRVHQFQQLWVRPVSALDESEAFPQVRVAAVEETELYSQLVGAGFSDQADWRSFKPPFTTSLDAPGTLGFIVSVGDQLAGGGMLGVVDGVAVLAGDSVLPQFRGKKLQQVLVRARLKRALELGCDLGQIARTLAERYPQAKVVGLDASAEAIAVASQAFGLPNLRFCAVDFSRPLDFPKGGVDLIVSTNALPYAQDQLGSARELFGLLSPQGLLLNHCRAEESQMFWDFPKSLVLPSNTQIFLSDWFAAARESGRNTEVLSVPLGMSATFYIPGQAKVFADPLNAYADAHRHDGPGPYAPWPTHVLLAHSAQARPANQAALPLSGNHMERLTRVLNSVAEAPREIQEAAIVAWICNARMFDVLPEALDYFEAVLPGSMPVLRPVLGASLKAED